MIALAIASTLATATPGAVERYIEFGAALIAADHWNTVCTQYADPTYYRHVDTIVQHVHTLPNDPISPLLKEQRPESLREKGRYTEAQCRRVLRKAERDYWQAWGAFRGVR